MAVEYIDRPPRIQPELPFAEHDIPQAPENPQAGQNLLQMLLPMLSMFGFIFLAGAGNIAMAIPMGLVMILSVGGSMMGGLFGGDFKKKKNAYEELLATMRQDMERSHNVQRIHYRHNYPDPQTLLEIAARAEKSRFGSRLWERRPSDTDFGVVRLGIGSRPSSVVYKCQKPDPLNPNPLAQDAEKLSNDSRIVTDVPVTIPLR